MYRKPGLGPRLFLFSFPREEERSGRTERGTKGKRDGSGLARMFLHIALDGAERIGQLGLDACDLAERLAFGANQFLLDIGREPLAFPVSHSGRITVGAGRAA